jgi:exocyst complex component 3
MDGVDTSSMKLAELLRHPDDLEKIPALKSEFARKKAAVDTQLRLGLQEQLNTTQSGVSAIGDGLSSVDALKEDMQKIDKLCTEAQNLITDLPNINLISQTHRNFMLVETMKSDIENFEQQMNYVERLLTDDDQLLDEQPNLLTIHYEITKLRDIRDSAIDQAKRAGEAGLELISNLQLPSGATLEEYFKRLDELVDFFDEHIGIICGNLIDLVSDNQGIVVRLALVIEEEERNDKKARALQEARNEYKELARHLKSITTNNVEIRGYKEKFLQSIEVFAKQKFDKSNEIFQEDPEKLEKSVSWWFNDLNTVKLGMVSLMPKKWRIFQTYASIYHRLMHDWLVARIDDPELRPPQMLAIVNWSEKYYKKNKKLGTHEDWLRPHVIDDRAAELIREYRQLIIKAVDEWMDRMSRTDGQSFTSRDETATDSDEHGAFRTKTMADMWRMLSQQLDVAASSERSDIVEGVVEAMFRALQSRQRAWEQLIDTDLKKYQDASSNSEGYGGFQDWLIAIANDQIACIDDDSDGNLGYLTRFSTDIQQHLPEEYLPKAEMQLDALRDGYVDLSTHCLSVFVSLIFAIDFKVVLSEFFTSAWYTKLTMNQAIKTFEDYLNDYLPVLHPSLQDILVQEMADRLLATYLSAVRNKGAKFRRQDPFAEKIRDDVVTVFDCFNSYPIFENIKNSWRIIQDFVDLLEVDKANVPDAFQNFKQQYPDAGMSWVEAALKTRDDYDRSMLNAVKARAATIDVQRSTETIMSKVK